jgi:hypothetical protein
LLKDRKELEQNLINTIKNKKLKTKRKSVGLIVSALRKNDIDEARFWINEPDKYIPELDTRELCLLTEQIYEQVEDDVVNPDIYFTEVERKKSKQFSGRMEMEKDINLPFTLDNMIMLNYNTFLGVISGEKLAKLSRAMLIHYNYDIQREHSYVKNREGGVQKKAKLIMQNVLEIKDNIKQGTQKHTQIVINAAIGTADAGEDEISYDPQNQRLTINRGTILDIVDGYHRTKATEMVYEETGDVDFNWILLLTNYSDEEARVYQGQLAKATPIAKERREELLGERKSDMVLIDVIPKSELKGRVSTSKDVHTVSDELVAYKVLAEEIDTQFDLEKMINVYKVRDYLTKFFNILLETFDDQFLINPNKYRNTSLINNNNIFVGYIVLARRMMDMKLEPYEIVRIVESIDFNKTAKHWIESGIVDDKGRITDTPKARNAIREYFSKLEI